jgi:uncharacterized protein involved in exopolysaccharide biosynthesis
MDARTKAETDPAISVFELYRVLWKARWPILITVTATTLIGLVLALVITKKYEATIVVSPVATSASSNQVGALVSQFSGLASLAGISGTVDKKVSESLAVLQSEALTRAYIEKNNLLPILFASKWDAANKRWRVSDPKKVPTLWRGNEYFRKRVRSVTSDSKTSLVTMTITWTDPVLAAKWANELVEYTNATLRDKAIAETDKNIAYLNSEARKTDMVEQRQAIYSLMQTEINRAMIARGNDEFALKVVDPAFVPERHYFPNTILWTIIGGVFGLLVSVAVVFIRHADKTGIETS